MAACVPPLFRLVMSSQSWPGSLACHKASNCVGLCSAGLRAIW